MPFLQSLLESVLSGLSEPIPVGSRSGNTGGIPLPTRHPTSFEETVPGLVMPGNRSNGYVCAPVTEITEKTPTLVDNSHNELTGLPDTLKPNKAQPFICIPQLE